MKVVIVYDSVFGNTEKIAQAMARAVGTTEILKVDTARADQLKGASLVLVGSPTRAFRPTPALSKWLKALPANSLKGVKVAAFDTRISVQDANSAILGFMVKLFGWAAAPIAKALVARGGTQVGTAEGFYVVASEGPLKDGEEARAAAWARHLIG
ncbi:MAG: flavodoxin family protein [Anaerolineae bacterium]